MVVKVVSFIEEKRCSVTSNVWLFITF